MDCDELAAALFGELQALQPAPPEEHIVRAADALVAWGAHAEDGDSHRWHEAQQEEGAVLLSLFAHASACPAVERLAGELLTSLAACPQCVVTYHAAQAAMEQEAPPHLAAAAAAELAARDEARVAAALGRAATAAGAEIAPEAVAALFEALSYQALLDDAAVIDAIEAALLALSREHDVELTEGGRYPGLYRLLAHGNPKLRALVSAAVRELGPFEDAAEVESIAAVLQQWDHTLANDLFEAAPAAQQGQRPRWQQPRQPLWLALNILFGLLRGPAMAEALSLMPATADAVASFACEGSGVSWPALGCLRSLLQALGPQAWTRMRMQPGALVARLAQVAGGALDARLLAHVAGALRAAAAALAPAQGQDRHAAARRRALQTLLQGFAAALTVADVAARGAFESLTPAAAAADAHVFGPALCRALSAPAAASPEVAAAALSCCRRLLAADAAALAAGNEAPVQSSPAESGGSSSRHQVCPALWAGLAPSALLDVSEALLGSAASLAHVTGAQGGGRAAVGAGFHGAGIGTMARVEAASAWSPADPNAANPAALEVADAPGLLLQAFRTAAASHLAQGRPEAAAFKGAEEQQRAAIVGALTQLLVGAHPPLQEQAGRALQRLSGCSSRQEAVAALVWQPACARAAFGALAASLTQLAAAPPMQALVRRDTPAALEAAAETLQASEGCGLDESPERRALVSAAWSFLGPALQQARQLAGFKTAAGALQALFRLLPVAWRESARPLLEAQALSARERARLTQRLSFLADALPWGGACEGVTARCWLHAVQEVLQSLGPDGKACLPPEALEAVQALLEPDSSAPDEARVLLGPLLGQQAPGNLAGLAPLPQRSKLSLPSLPPAPKPSQQQQQQQPPAHPPSWMTKAASAGPVIDLEEEEEPPGFQAAQPPSSSAKGPAADWGMPATHRQLPQARGGVFANRGAGAAGHAGQQARLDQWQRRPGSAQKAPIAFASAGLTGKAAKRKGEELDLERLWADARKAAAERPSSSAAAEKLTWAAVREATASVAAAAKPKGGHTKLRALIDRAEAEGRDANRRLPRGERQGAAPPPPPPPARRQRQEPAVLAHADPFAGGAGPALREAPDRPQEPLDRDGKRARLGLPAVPKPARKAIQLEGAPAAGGGSAAAAAARRTAAAAAQPAVLSLEQVQQELLAWDYYDLIGQAGGSRRAAGGKLQAVPSRFASLAQYTEVFRALLLEELRASILQAHTEGLSGGGSKRKASKGPERAATFPLAVASLQRRSLLHRVELLLDGSLRAECRAEDLLLLHQPAAGRKPPEAGENRREAARRPLEAGGKPPETHTHLLALVERVEPAPKGRGQQLVTAHVNLLPQQQQPGGAAARLARASETLLPGVTWRATRLLSTTPHFRQLVALCRVHTLPAPLRSQLLQPQPPQPPPAGTQEAALEKAVPRPLLAALRAGHNASQLAAIAGAVAGGQQLTLIQGPPGTGKSATVLAIISALLAGARAADAPPPPPPGAAAGNAARGRPSAAAKPPPPVAPAARVLVCAQSNAAVDELVARLAHPGVLNGAGQRRVPSMLRFGPLEAAHPRVKAFHIDAIAGAMAAASAELATAQSNAETAKAAAAELQWKLREAAAAAAAPEGAAEQERQLAGRRQMERELRAAKAKARTGGEALARAKKEVRQAAVQAAEVVACTLASAGGDLATLCRGKRGFQALIVDEAAQALEPAAHIPLQLLAEGARIVLVGDPKQLPATVLSRAGEAANLAQSLFERLQRAGWPVTLLSAQYRMHPAIAEWPARFFYGGQLADAVAAADRAAAFHGAAHFPPLALFDCRDGQEQGGGAASGSGGGSLANAAEADLVCALLTGLASSFPGALQQHSCAVLTPYRAQAGLLKARLAAALGSACEGIDVSTVDGYQGKEADVVVFSCVRAQPPGRAGSVGFLADVRRMNVALTRARRALWVVGHTDTLRCSPPWAALCEHARTRGCLLPARPPYGRMFTGGSGSSNAREARPSLPPLAAPAAAAARKPAGSKAKRPADAQPPPAPAKRQATGSGKASKRTPIVWQPSPSGASSASRQAGKQAGGAGASRQAGKQAGGALGGAKAEGLSVGFLEEGQGSE